MTKFVGNLFRGRFFFYFAALPLLYYVIRIVVCLRKLQFTRITCMFDSFTFQFLAVN